MLSKLERNINCLSPENERFSTARRLEPFGVDFDPAAQDTQVQELPRYQFQDPASLYRTICPCIFFKTGVN